MPEAGPARNFSTESLSNKEEREKLFEAWMRQEGAKIYNLAVRLTGNLADGQDLAQETLIKAFEHFDDFRGDAQLATWTYRICVNLWKNRLRSQKRRFFWHHISLSGGSEEDDSRPLDLPDPHLRTDKPLEAAERQKMVHLALDQLTPEDRGLIIMRDMEDRSYEDIARLLDWPLGTVKSRLARTREKLKVLLEKYFKP